MRGNVFGPNVGWYESDDRSGLSDSESRTSTKVVFSIRTDVVVAYKRADGGRRTARLIKVVSGTGVPIVQY